MGVIIASFPGCGKTFLKAQYEDKVRITDLCFSTKEDKNYVEEIKSAVKECDIVFVRSNIKTIDLLCDDGVDFDVFYPDYDKTQEIIESCVKKRIPSKDIAKLDQKYPELIKSIDAIDDEHCFKHKLQKGQYLCTDEQLSKFLKSFG